MARTVREIMNPELFSVTAGARASDTLEAILGFGITAAPVLDDERRPIGVTSLRDLVGVGAAPVPIRSPAVTIARDASIEELARCMDDAELHHVVVVDDDGRAVGMASSLDVVRALAGLPAKHPATFPHRDARFDVSWTDDAMVEQERAETAPEGPGILVLTRGARGRADVVVWVEATGSLRGRVRELAAVPQDDTPALAAILAHRDVRFRCARVSDGDKRVAIARAIRETIDHPPPPRGVARPLH